jgi:hypothetical protein
VAANVYYYYKIHALIWTTSDQDPLYGAPYNTGGAGGSWPHPSIKTEFKIPVPVGGFRVYVFDEQGKPLPYVGNGSERGRTWFYSGVPDWTNPNNRRISATPLAYGGAGPDADWGGCTHPPVYKALMWSQESPGGFLDQKIANAIFVTNKRIGFIRGFPTLNVTDSKTKGQKYVHLPYIQVRTSSTLLGFTAENSLFPTPSGPDFIVFPKCSSPNSNPITAFFKKTLEPYYGTSVYHQDLIRLNYAATPYGFDAVQPIYMATEPGNILINEGVLNPESVLKPDGSIDLALVVDPSTGLVPTEHVLPDITVIPPDPDTTVKPPITGVLPPPDIIVRPDVITPPTYIPRPPIRPIPDSDPRRYIYVISGMWVTPWRTPSNSNYGEYFTRPNFYEDPEFKWARDAYLARTGEKLGEQNVQLYAEGGDTFLAEQGTGNPVWTPYLRPDARLYGAFVRAKQYSGSGGYTDPAIRTDGYVLPDAYFQVAELGVPLSQLALGSSGVRSLGHHQGYEVASGYNPSISASIDEYITKKLSGRWDKFYGGAPISDYQEVGAPYPNTVASIGEPQYARKMVMGYAMGGVDAASLARWNKNRLSAISGFPVAFMRTKEGTLLMHVPIVREYIVSPRDDPTDIAGAISVGATWVPPAIGNTNPGEFSAGQPKFWGFNAPSRPAGGFTVNPFIDQLASQLDNGTPLLYTGKIYLDWDRDPYNMRIPRLVYAPSSPDELFTLEPDRPSIHGNPVQINSRSTFGSGARAHGAAAATASSSASAVAYWDDYRDYLAYLATGTAARVYAKSSAQVHATLRGSSGTLTVGTAGTASIGATITNEIEVSVGWRTDQTPMCATMVGNTWHAMGAATGAASPLVASQTLTTIVAGIQTDADQLYQPVVRSVARTIVRAYGNAQVAAHLDDTTGVVQSAAYASGAGYARITQRVRHYSYYEAPEVARSDGLRSLVLQCATSGLTTYTNMRFNSMVQTPDGKIYAAGAHGVYELGGDTDMGAPIDAHLVLGFTDFGSTARKRVDNVYIGYAGSAPLRAVLVTESAPIEYQVSIQPQEHPLTCRVKPAMGHSGRYWKLILKNTGGSSFKINAIDVSLAVSKRNV